MRHAKERRYHRQAPTDAEARHCAADVAVHPDDLVKDDVAVQLRVVVPGDVSHRVAARLPHDHEVAVVVLLLVYGGTIEQLTGSALVSGDPRQAIVRATMAAVNRRLDALLG